MISYVDSCLEEIEEARASILSYYHRGDYEGLFQAVNQLDAAVHRLNNPNEEEP